MHQINRRRFLELAGVAAAGAALPCSVGAAIPARVVVVGGGFGGATVAKYLCMWGGGKVAVTLVEPNPSHIACILSNLVVTGALAMDRITLGYSALRTRHGVSVVQGRVTAINYGSGKGTVSLSSGTSLDYDHLVLSPGIDFIPPPDSSWDPTLTPHAWQAGPQTLLLKKQLASMQDRDTFVMTVPRSPYRCPPGPYERACVVADYLKRKRLNFARVVVLDANAGIQAEPIAFGDAFNFTYKGMIDYVPNATVASVNSQTRSIVTSAGTWSNVRVLNYIPNQRAAAIDPTAPGRGWPLLNAQGFVPVDPLAYGISGFPNIHVIGDACALPASDGKAVPKSGHMANAQAKVCADAILRALNGEAPDTNVTTNSACFSPITSTTASWLSANFNYGDIYDAAGKVKGKGMHRVDLGEAPKTNGDNYQDMFTWAEGLFADSFV